MEHCNNWQERISAFLDGILPESERLELMEHLESCADCRAYFDDQLTIHAALAGPETEAPAGFCEQIMSRVKETKQDKPEKKVIAFPVWRRWAATAACCAIAVLGILGLGGERGGTDDMQLQSAVSYSAVTASEYSVSVEAAKTDVTEDMVLYAANSSMAEAKSAAPAADTAPEEPAESPLQDTARETAVGCTLPGATEINPSVMVNGQVYTWTGMAFGAIPDSFRYLCDLQHIEDDSLTEDGQFIASFAAEGEIYTDPDIPNTVYIRINTDWLDGEYVEFSLSE